MRRRTKITTIEILIGVAIIGIIAAVIANVVSGGSIGGMSC